MVEDLEVLIKTLLEELTQEMVVLEVLAVVEAEELQLEGLEYLGKEVMVEVVLRRGPQAVEVLAEAEEQVP
jgi:hypothetical protein